MSTVTSRARDSYSQNAGRQLVLLAFACISGFVVLMLALAWASDGDVATGVDTESATIPLALTSEPPQLDSTRATDQVSGHILGPNPNDNIGE